MRRRRRATPAAAPRRSSRAAAALVLAAIAVLVSAVSATGPFGALVPRRALKQDLLAAETTTSSSAASCLTCDTLETCIKARCISSDGNYNVSGQERRRRGRSFVEARLN